MARSSFVSSSFVQNGLWFLYPPHSGIPEFGGIYIITPPILIVCASHVQPSSILIRSGRSGSRWKAYACIYRFVVSILHRIIIQHRNDPEKIGVMYNGGARSLSIGKGHCLADFWYPPIWPSGRMSGFIV